MSCKRTCIRCDNSPCCSSHVSPMSAGLVSGICEPSCWIDVTRYWMRLTSMGIVLSCCRRSWAGSAHRDTCQQRWELESQSTWQVFWVHLRSVYRIEHPIWIDLLVVEADALRTEVHGA